MSAPRASPREWAIVAAVAAAMLFGTGTTFAGLGVVLFAMQGSFGWSASEAGGGFTVLVVACCLAQMIPVALIQRIGARWTMVVGCGLFAVAFAVGAMAEGLVSLYAAIGLIGIAFALISNTPGVYLIAGWSRERAPRMIGLYLMLGTLGSAVGPPIAQALVSSAAGWRAFWVVMAVAALVLGVLCAVLIREPPVRAAEPSVPQPRWRFASDLLSARFLILAAAMVATQVCVVTVSSVAPAHLVAGGWSDGFAARMLGAQGLIAALGTGASGFLTRWLPPRTMLVGALVLQAIGVLLLAVGSEPWAVYLFAPCFGIGWSVTSFAVTVLLVAYFGNVGGSTALATTWMLTGLSAFGPWIAGMTADAGHDFGPALAVFALLLLPVAAGAALMARPQPGPLPA